jgi:hypothetical protein
MQKKSKNAKIFEFRILPLAQRQPVKREERYVTLRTKYSFRIIRNVCLKIFDLNSKQFSNAETFEKR